VTKGRLFWLAYATCLGLAVFWGVRLLPPGHGINLESYDKIQIGMTLEEVKVLLKVPPGDYSTRPYLRHKSEDRRGFNWELQWIGNDCRIGLRLDKRRKVAGHGWEEHIPTGEETFFDKLCRWMPFQGENKPIISIKPHNWVE
jgi:hypothetical protein